MRRAIFVLVMVALSACSAGDAQNGASTSADGKIVGGSVYSGLPSVGEVTRNVQGGYVLCTGTLVAPNYVLTAAHCMDQNSAEVDRVDVTFNLQDPQQGNVQLTSTHVSIPSNYFTDTVGGFDLALVKLSQAANETPLALMQNETTQDLGNQVFLVGYGQASGSGRGTNGAGVKRAVNASVSSLDGNFLWFGDAQGDSCSGDSGGPVLHQRSDNTYEIAATVRGGTFGQGTPKCEGLSFGPRVDSHLDWINQVTGGAAGNPNASNPNSSGNANSAGNPNSSGGTNITCSNLGSWDPNSAAFEAQVLQLVNQARAQGADCHSEGTFGPQAPLSADPALTCLARAYAQDMSVNNFFSHTDQNGKSPFDRMAAAGIKFSAAGENIAEGQTTPQEVVQAWLDSDGHCANIMGGYTLTGLGFYKDVWVQDFTHP